MSDYKDDYRSEFVGKQIKQGLLYGGIFFVIFLAEIVVALLLE